MDFFGFLRGKLLFSALDLAVGCLLLQNQCGSLRCLDSDGGRIRDVLYPNILTSRMTFSYVFISTSESRITNHMGL